ncbi:hypothetical protein KBD34_01690 [Patescibacteria group bacterium]|nr:hypothetical protein [Patescibacteria group bacterium]
MENPQYIVGARRNTDGSLDVSRSLIWKKALPAQEAPKNIFTPAEIHQLMNRLNDSTFARQNLLKYLAKQKAAPESEILREFQKAAVKRIKETEPGNLRHYHRTSFEALRTIVETGTLLSRTKIKEKFPGKVMSAWSSSDNIMMTRDMFDRSGKLLNPGYTPDEGGIGASGGSAVLVFRQTIMDQDDYDATRRYPEMSEIPFQEYCEAILVRTEQDQASTEQLLAQHHIHIPVVLASQWKRSS